MNLKHLVFLLLLFVCVNLSAQTKEKQITISFSNIPLSEAMARIEKASGYTFFYDAKQTDIKQTVSLNAKKELISEALKKMFSKNICAATVIRKRFTPSARTTVPPQRLILPTTKLMRTNALKRLCICSGARAAR